jgi:cobalt-zinc-cadmium efflux system membrane fusion protein
MDQPTPEIGIESKTIETQTESRRPSRHRYAVIGILVIAALLIAAFLVRQEGRTNVAASEQPAPSSPDVIEATPEQLRQIRVEPVRDQEIEFDLQTTGKVGFNEDRMTPVFAPYSGRVMEILANKGDIVEGGQSLLIIDSPELVATVHDLAEARADADKAKIALDSADKAATRARNLHSLDALATKELQEAESEAARTREDFRRATAAVNVMRNKLSLFGKGTDEIRQMEESVADQIDRRIHIRAPLSGTIVDRKVGPGQYIKPDMPDPLYLIGDLSKVWVNADIYENYLSKVRIGAPVTVTVAAYPDQEFPARITAINPTVDAATRTIHVRCSVSNSQGLLKPEMFANIRIGSTGKRKVTTVPSAAVLTQGSESFVLREESAGKFRRRQVKSGPEVHGYIVIDDGLAANDRVVTSGTLLLSNGFSEK